MSVLLPVVSWTWHEGVLCLLVLTGTVATVDTEVNQYVGTFGDATDNLGQQTIGGTHFHLMGLEHITFLGPYLEVALAILHLLLFGEQGLVGREAQCL